MKLLALAQSATFGSRAQARAPYHPENTMLTVSMVVVASQCIVSGVTGKLVKVEGKRDGAKYRTILEEIMCQPAKKTETVA